MPHFVQYTMSTGPGMTGPRFNSRSFTSGCRSGSLFTPVRRAEALAARAAPDRILGRSRRNAGVGSAAPRPAPAAATSLSASAAAAGALRFELLVREPARVRRVVRDAAGFAAVTLELRLDPVHRFAVALGPFAAVAELRQPLDRRLVLLEVETGRRACERRPAASPPRPAVPG